MATQGGAGAAFCAGHSLDEMRVNHGMDYYRELFERCSHVMTGIVRLPQPGLTGSVADSRVISGQALQIHRARQRLVNGAG